MKQKCVLYGNPPVRMGMPYRTLSPEGVRGRRGCEVPAGSFPLSLHLPPHFIKEGNYLTVRLLGVE